MSSALVRQALEFVDPGESSGKRQKRTSVAKLGSLGQVYKNQSKNKVKNIKKNIKSEDQKIEENIKKLLALSEPIAEKEIAETIIKRASKGKPVLDKIEIEQEKFQEKSILFPEDDNKPVKKSRKRNRRNI